MYSIFDSFFGPTRIVVVSEERLREAERKAKQEQIEAVDARIRELNEYKAELVKEIAGLQGTEEKKELPN